MKPDDLSDRMREYAALERELRIAAVAFREAVADADAKLDAWQAACNARREVEAFFQEALARIAKHCEGEARS